MPAITRIANKFLGLRPGINRMQDDEIGVLKGKNFRYSIKGLYSGWGNTTLEKSLPFDVNTYPEFATFRVEDQVILCSSVGIFKRNLGGWECVVKNEPKIWANCEDNEYPWSAAFVGDTWFFAHPTFGLAGYSHDTCSWHKASFCTGVKDKATYIKFKDYLGPEITEPIYSIASSNNRLILQAYDTVSWSEIDNGFVFDENIHNGTGFQNSSVNEFGRPLGVFTSKSGFIAYSTNGIVAYTARNDEAAFTAEQKLSSDRIPVNPYTIIKLDNKLHIILTKAGLFVLDHDYPQEWEPLIGKWLSEGVLAGLQAYNDQRAGIRFFYSCDTQEFFISLSNIIGVKETAKSKVYSRSLVFHETYKQWASFDQYHRFIGDVNFQSHRTSQINLGFFGPKGQINWFDHGDSNDDCPLDSFINLGIFQVKDPNDATLRSELFNFRLYGAPILTSASDRQISDELSNNYAGLDDITQTSGTFQVKAAGTIDGYTTPNGQFQTAIPTDVQFNSQNYSCNLTGAGYIIQLSATRVGDFYSLSRCDLEITI
jgi:hypothetical protein